MLFQWSGTSCWADINCTDIDSQQLSSFVAYNPGPKNVGSRTRPLFPPSLPPSSPFPSSPLRLLSPPHSFFPPLLPFLSSLPSPFPSLPRSDPLKQARGSGSALAPQRGPGRSSGRQCIVGEFSAQETRLVAANHVHFLLNKMWKCKFK